METTDLTNLQVAKWYVVLGLSGKLNMQFVMSILNREGELTETQKTSFGRCVDSLKMREKVEKFNTTDCVPYFSTELEFDDKSICSATNSILDGVDVIVKDKLLYSVDAWKISHKATKVKTVVAKPKKKLSDLL